MRILHVFRSPVGGLFRHVRDLAREQHALGHEVGLFCDSSTGGPLAEATLNACTPFCSAGIVTRPIPRLPAPADLKVITHATRMAREGGYSVIHGHGAKGGLVARIAARSVEVPSVYTPHGGSLHYAWRSPSGAAFLATEKLLARAGSGFVFVCDFEKRAFAEKIGLAGKPSVVAHNGLWPEEFEPISPAADATDLLFVGEVRHLKGVDILLNVVAALPTVTLTIVGDGPELSEFQNLANTLGLSGRVRFAGRLPIRTALTMGRVMVVPSRNESFPYVVLETAAAAVPMIATRVGGISEVLPDDMLCEPQQRDLLRAVSTTLADLPAATTRARQLATSMRSRFSTRTMASTITDFYAGLRP